MAHPARKKVVPLTVMIHTTHVTLSELEHIVCVSYNERACYLLTIIFGKKFFFFISSKNIHKSDAMSNIISGEAKTVVYNVVDCRCKKWFVCVISLDYALFEICFLSARILFFSLRSKKTHTWRLCHRSCIWTRLFICIKANTRYNESGECILTPIKAESVESHTKFKCYECLFNSQDLAPEHLFK